MDPEDVPAVEDLRRKRELLMQQKKEKEEQLANLQKQGKATNLKRSRSKKDSEDENPKKKSKKNNGEPSEKKHRSADDDSKKKTDKGKASGAMTLDQLRQFHELRQEHKRDRKLIEEQQAKLAELSKNFNERINSLQGSLDILLGHFGLQAQQVLKEGKVEGGQDDAVMQEATF